MAIIKKTRNNGLVRVQGKGNPRALLVGQNSVQPLKTTIWGFLKKLRMERTYDPAIPLLGLYPQKMKILIWEGMCVPCLVAQSYLTLCNPMDCSPPGSSVHGILQARKLEWVAISSFSRSSQPRDRSQVSHIAGRFFTIWATREAHIYPHFHCSVQFSHSIVSNCLWPHGLQHARPPWPSPTPGTYSNSCPETRWCHPTISSSVIPFSSCLQSFLASGSFPLSQFFPSGGQRIGVSASAISPSSEYSGLISFRMDLLELLAV